MSSVMWSLHTGENYFKHSHLTGTALLKTLGISKIKLNVHSSSDPAFLS
jgi:hypothetical protein